MRCAKCERVRMARLWRESEEHRAKHREYTRNAMRKLRARQKDGL